MNDVMIGYSLTLSVKEVIDDIRFFYEVCGNFIFNS